MSVPLSYKQALRKAVFEILVSNMGKAAWLEASGEILAALRDLGWVVLVIFVRLLLVVLFPISIPLIAWMIRYGEKKEEEQRAKMREEWYADRNKLVQKAPSE